MGIQDKMPWQNFLVKSSTKPQCNVWFGKFDDKYEEEKIGKKK